MNIFGIDHQSTFTSIALREDSSACAHGVGDGRQLVIPNFTAEPELWGTRAVERGAADALYEGFRENRTSCSMFWRGVAARLHSYLGRMAPVRTNGYRIVASIGSELAADDVATVARQAGLDDFEVISPVDALRFRWMASLRAPLARPQNIVVVACGDRSVEVEAFQVEDVFARGLQVLARSGGTTLDQRGHAVWSAHLIEVLRERLIEAEKTPLTSNPAVQRSLRRVASRLARERGSFEWYGGLEGHVFAPVRVSLEACRRWPEAVSVAAALGPTVTDQLRPIAAGPRPDLIIVGGIGALWPFAVDAARALGDVWMSTDPAADVAVGAAWWPDQPNVLEPLPKARLRIRPDEEAIEVMPREEASREPPEVDPLPPWVVRSDHT